MNTQQKILDVVHLLKEFEIGLFKLYECSSRIAKEYEELGWEAQEMVYSMIDDKIKEKRDKEIYIKAALEMSGASPQNF